MLRTRNKTIAIVAILFFCAMFVGLFDTTYAAESNEVTVVCADKSYGNFTVKVDAKSTGLSMKEELASKINDGGISPEEIIILYNPWGKLKEQVSNETKTEAYIGKKFWYLISPLSKGEIFKSGDVVDFGKESAAIYANYNNEEEYVYFYGENAMSYHGCRELKDGKKYAKYIIGSTAIYLPLGGEKPTGLSVENISYDPYNKAFIHGFGIYSGE